MWGREKRVSLEVTEQNYNAEEMRIGSFKVIDDGPAMLHCSVFVLHKVCKINRG